MDRKHKILRMKSRFYNRFLRKKRRQENLVKENQMMFEIDDAPERDTKGLLEHIGHVLGAPRLKRYVSLGGELIEAFSPFLEKPTVWTAFQALFQGGKVLVDDAEVWADDYFTSDVWEEPYSADFNQTLAPVLKRFPYERVRTTEENTYIRICTLPNGVKCGWTVAGKLHQIDRIFVEANRVDEGRECIKQLLWAQFKGKSLVMRKNSTFSTKDPRVIFEIDNAFESRTSQRAVTYSELFGRYIKEGVHRSVMFYGPPGTGKSTLARTIIERMNMRSFRIRIGDVDNLDNATLFEALSIFEPDAVILDDFDRASAQAQLLETMEQFQRTVKLVIVTVNDPHRLEDALKRPERIDERFLIDKMDEEVVRHVLGDFADGFETVKDWPIVFITEYVKRRRFMKPDEAVESIKDLAARVDEMSSYRDRNQVDVMKLVGLLSAKKAPKEELEFETEDSDYDDIDD